MKSFFSFIITLLISLSVSFGQSTQSEISKNFDFNEESDPSEFSVNIAPNTTSLDIELNSIISAGNLKVSLLSPNGERKGGFQLQCSTQKNDGSSSNSNSSTNHSNTSSEHTYTIVSSNPSKAKGNMSKSIKNPETGNWKLVIKPEMVTGMLALRIRQLQYNQE